MVVPETGASVLAAFMSATGASVVVPETGASVLAAFISATGASVVVPAAGAATGTAPTAGVIVKGATVPSTHTQGPEKLAASGQRFGSTKPPRAAPWKVIQSVSPRVGMVIITSGRLITLPGPQISQGGKPGLGGIVGA